MLQTRRLGMEAGKRLREQNVLHGGILDNLRELARASTSSATRNYSPGIVISGARSSKSSRSSSCSVTSLPESPRHRDVKIQDFTSSAVVVCEFQLECGHAVIPDQRSDPPQAMRENPRRICQILVACVEEKEIKESIACSSTKPEGLGKSGGGYVKLERKLALKLAASSITAGQATE
ncbi:hypothetical protein SELMODRAFT_419817 [Selaginella moellendorffii]|uniref:Uncharacterized protein n=1 Tax=Selaginella moellendorffii TaxID=88036 RepID=D8SAM9_SELML|nr:hypothetical protein SELMODRAFT_419817 [Selaginella moellendorffii]